jgi:hypothetical protein
MDKIEFILFSDDNGIGVDIFINGKNLLDIIRKWEEQLREYKISLFVDSWDKERFGKEIDQHRGIYPVGLIYELETKKTPAVLGCTCGSIYCYPFLVRVLETEKTIIWSESKLNNYLSDYDSLLKPLNFEFDKKQYRKEIKKLKSVAIEFEAIDNKRWTKKSFRNKNYNFK